MAKMVCRYCGSSKSNLDFPKTNAIWFRQGYCDLCFDCLHDIFDYQDLQQVDKMLQYLDVPFFPDDWIKLFEDNGATTLRAYILKNQARLERPNRVDWAEVNNTWKNRQNSNMLNKYVEIMNEEWLAKARKRWGDNYTSDELEVMEKMYDDTDHTQNIITSIQKDQAENLCRLSITIRNKIRSGEDASKELKSYNDLVKAGGFEPKNSRNYGELESVGELMNFLVKKGYTPQFYDGKDRDLADLTIHNQQTYLRRLVQNEPNLGELVRERAESYKISQQLAEENRTDEELESYDASAPAIVEYDDDDGGEITDE